MNSTVGRKPVLMLWLTTLAVAATMIIGLASSQATVASGTCTDVVVVLDESGSVGSQEDKVRSATSAFLDGLADQGPRAAVVEFGTRARTAVAHTAVTSTSVAEVFDAYLAADYDSPSQTGPYTNWDDALTKVGLLNETLVAPLVLFVTDGDPTAYNRDGVGEDGGVSFGLDLTAAAHARAMEEAARVEAQGSHILAVGVGGATTPDSMGRLMEIAGPNVYDGTGVINPFGHDVVLAESFADLGPVLRDVATAMCAEPGISISKTAEVTMIRPGDAVTYEIVVTNTGNVELVDVVVSDPTLPACDFYVGDLPVGKDYTYTCTTELLATTTNVAYVTGATPTGSPVDDSDDAVVTVVADPSGTGTPGYWKNHPEAWVIVNDQLLVGDWNRNGSCDAGEVCLELSGDEAMAALTTAPKGDSTYNVARPLVAAWLNVAAFNEASCIVGDVNAAISWLHSYPIGSDPAGSAWGEIAETATRLDDYNNGLLCAESRDAGGDKDDEPTVEGLVIAEPSPVPTGGDDESSTIESADDTATATNGKKDAAPGQAKKAERDK